MAKSIASSRQRLMSKLVLIPSLFALVALAACSSPEAGGNAPAPAPEVAESDLATGATCDQSELFVKQGLAQDMRDTLGASFVKDYQINVPGAVIAYDSYGGDMIQGPLGASASAAKVFDVHPGGNFSGAFGGSSTNGDKFTKRGFTAAKALFAAMNGATQTSATDQGWTTTTRKSKGGRFSCEQRTNGGAVKDASCSFGDLLMIHVVSWPKSAADFCVQ